MSVVSSVIAGVGPTSAAGVLSSGKESHLSGPVNGGRPSWASPGDGPFLQALASLLTGKRVVDGQASSVLGGEKIVPGGTILPQGGETLPDISGASVDPHQAAHQTVMMFRDPNLPGMFGVSTAAEQVGPPLVAFAAPSGKAVNGGATEISLESRVIPSRVVVPPAAFAGAQSPGEAPSAPEGLSDRFVATPVNNPLNGVTVLSEDGRPLLHALQHQIETASMVAKQVADIPGVSILNGPGADGVLIAPPSTSLSTAHGDSGANIKADTGILQAPIGRPEWGEEFGNRIRWLVTQNNHQAELRLNPPHLGAIEVKISVQNEHTHVNFVVQHAIVREAVEESLPRLREMMAQGGLSLGNVDVSDHSHSKGHPGHAYEADPDQESVSRVNGLDVGQTIDSPVLALGSGLLDCYV